MNFLITFADGHSSPVKDARDGGQFWSGIAYRRDGLARCVFIGKDGQPHADTWLITERTAVANQIRSIRAEEQREATRAGSQFGMGA